MATIRIPQPPKSAFNKGRPVSGLLRSHMEHLQRAEFRLPANMQTNIYINTVKTEGEAADYIRLVTERLHAAHGHKVAPKPKSRTKTVTIAAMAEKRPKRKNRSVKKAKSKGRTVARSEAKGRT